MLQYAAIAMLMLGLYGLLTQRNVIKIIVSLNIFEIGLNLFIISVGYVDDGIAPILTSDFNNNGLIFVDPLPSAVGAISGGASVCEGATGNVFTISSVSNASDYTWTVPSGSTITAGMGSTSITVTFGSTAGDITITPSNACGNGTAAILPIALTNSVTPTIFIAATDTSICSGQQVDFTANTANGGLTPTYVWKINGTPSLVYSVSISTKQRQDR